MIIDRVDEEFLLLALEVDGHWTTTMDCSLGRALAAAWIAELVVEGRLRFHRGKIVARTRTPIGDATLDWVMDSIRAPKRPKPAKRWVRRLARGAKPHIPAVLQRLHGRGHIDIVRNGRQTLYPSHGSQARNELREHLRMVLFGARGADDSAIALLAILDGAGLFDHVFGALAPQAEESLGPLLHRDHRFFALRHTLGTRKRRRQWER